MHFESIGNTATFCCVSNFQIVFRGFSCFLCRSMPNNAKWLGASIGTAQYKGEKKSWSKCRVFPIRGDNTYWVCFTVAETEIHKIKDDGKIKRQTNLDHLGPRPIANVCHLPGAPSFSLPTTFQQTWSWQWIDYNCTTGLIPFHSINSQVRRVHPHQHKQVHIGHTPKYKHNHAAIKTTFKC